MEPLPLVSLSTLAWKKGGQEPETAWLAAPGFPEHKCYSWTSVHFLLASLHLPCSYVNPGQSAGATRTAIAWLRMTVSLIDWFPLCTDMFHKP